MARLTGARYEDRGFSVNACDLIRKPWTKEALGKESWIYEEPRFYPAPDGRLCLVTSHFREWRMGWYEGLFSLIGRDGGVIEAFEPLTASGDGGNVQWGADSGYCVVPLADYITFLVLDLAKPQDKKFALLKVKSWGGCRLGFDGSRALVVSCEGSAEEETRDRRAGTGEIIEDVPSKRHVFPEPKKIPIRDLLWNAFGKLAQWRDLAKQLPELDMMRREAGFFEYRGKYPESTVEMTESGRQLEAHALELFAEYGDKQSIDWYLELFEKTKGRYGSCDVVEKYLGERRRTMAPSIGEPKPAELAEALRAARSSPGTDIPEGAKGCPQCAGKPRFLLDSFNWREAQEPSGRYHECVSSMDYRGRARKGRKYRCCLCPTEWYLSSDGETMFNLRPMHDAFYHWNERPHPVAAELKARLDEMGGVQFRHLSGNIIEVYPCEARTTKGVRLPLALVLVSDDFPAQFGSGAIRMVSEIASIKKVYCELTRDDLLSLCETGKYRGLEAAMFVADRAS